MNVIEEICTITARGQTTVPKAVRQALGVGYGGRIAFRVEGNTVSIHALPGEDEEDSALGPFLSLLQADFAGRPTEAIQPMTPALGTRLEALAAEIGDVDPDAPIEGDSGL